MAAKLIIKRKREQNLHLSPSCSPNSVEPVVQAKRSKDTPNISAAEQVVPNSTTDGKVTTNKFLKEALQKIVELQNELDDFEADLNESGEYYEEDSEESFGSEHQSTNNSHQWEEAEALGFAICARETMLFLEREGIPTSSEVYKALREKLIGSTEGIPI